MKKFFWLLLNVITLGAASLIANYVAKRREKAAQERAIGRYVKETLDVLLNIKPTRPTGTIAKTKMRRTPLEPIAMAARKTTKVAVRHDHKRVVGELGGTLGRGNRVMVVLPDGKVVTRRRANTKVVSA